MVPAGKQPCLWRDTSAPQSAVACSHSVRGGTSLRPLRTPLFFSALRDSTSWGVLRLSLRSAGYGWDFIPIGQHVPCGESSQWGDYHLREAALTVQRMAEGKAPYRFDGPV